MSTLVKNGFLYKSKLVTKVDIYILINIKFGEQLGKKGKLILQAGWQP